MRIKKTNKTVLFALALLVGCGITKQEIGPNPQPLSGSPDIKITADRVNPELMHHRFSQPMGGDSSGGGGAVVCRSTDKKITSVDTLDLFEGKIRFGLDIPSSPDPVNKQLLLVTSRLGFNFALRQDFEASLLFVLTHQKLLPPGITLYPTRDLGKGIAVVLPAGCNLELAAHMDEDGWVTITSDLFNAMNSTQQAAILVHEAVYSMARFFSKVNDSASSRKFTSHLFAKGIASQKLAELSKEMTWRSEFLQPVLVKDTGSTFHLELNNPQQQEVLWGFTCLDGMGNPISRLPHASNEPDPQPSSIKSARFSAELPNGCAVVSFDVINILPDLNPVEYKVSYGNILLTSGSTGRINAWHAVGMIPIYYGPQ